MSFELHPKLAGDCETLCEFDLCTALLMRDDRFPWVILVPRQPSNVASVDAGAFLARRRREVVPGVRRASATVRRKATGEGGSGVHPKGASASAHPRCWRLSTYAR